jgi:hypothetical protein
VPGPNGTAAGIILAMVPRGRGAWPCDAIVQPALRLAVWLITPTVADAASRHAAQYGNESFL